MYYQKTRYSKSKKNNYNGYIYDSKFEAGYAQELDLRKRAKDIKDWERQHKIEIIWNGYHICDYKIDFKIYHNDGTVELTELKGWPITDVWKLKWKLTEAMFADDPNTTLTVIYQGKTWKPRMRKIKK